MKLTNSAGGKVFCEKFFMPVYLLYNSMILFKHSDLYILFLVFHISNYFTYVQYLSLRFLHKITYQLI